MQLIKAPGLIITLLFTVSTSFAQTPKTQPVKQQSDWDDNDTEKPVRFNYVIDDPMDKFGRQNVTTSNPGPHNTVFLVPEFYFPQPKKVKDTTFRFECYDSRDTLISDVKNYDLIHFYSLFKEYNDPVQTYNDNGVKKPLPISSIIKRYDQIAKDKWMSVEYPGNKYLELRGNRNIIVGSDTTTVFDPIDGSPNSVIYRYYKVTKN